MPDEPDKTMDEQTEPERAVETGSETAEGESEQDDETTDDSE